jgi:hypothetical protein
MDIGLFGKYPFHLGGKFTVFPLLGIDYRVVLSAEDKATKMQPQNADGDDDPGRLSALWFKLGGGLDFAITEALYLRGEILYGIRLRNGDEKEYSDTLGSDATYRLGNGFTIKAALAYRFN